MAKRKRDAVSSSATQGFGSSSSPFPSSGSEYEVFLSFRGEDTRKTFTDHLYTALVQRGIHTFRDDDELRIGEEIGPKLWSAIHQSKIAIPILSRDYASSKWCLRELAEIVECMKEEEEGGKRQITVMPVFYHVSPSDVRNQTGSYEEAFKKHEEKFSQETEGWKKALKVVSDLKGWESEKIADGHESELIQLIVKEVWSELRKTPLIVPDDNLVGIHSHVEEMMKLLNIGSNDVRTVGIHGLGGIGKTTIARYVYKTVYHHFDGCSFIADARETFRLRGLVHLQSQLIINILNIENPNITSVDHGMHMIRQRLSKKKVLIVLDDVDQNIDLNAIIGNCDWFGYGSRIIITTRDKHILDVHGVDRIYEPKEMDQYHSLQLFSKYAFKLDQPPKQNLALSIDVVKTIGGLPLALEVIGSSLFGRKDSVFKAMVEKLKKCPNSEVQKKLKISYDELQYEEQEMFLDIACFLIGMDKKIAWYILDGCNFFPEAGMDVLHGKSLVKIGENNELLMHDQLRDLGREIVRQESPKELGKRSRLWSHDALEVLNTKMGTEKVEGLDFRGQLEQSFKNEGFAAMTNIRLLRLDYAIVSGNFSFSELRWLRWMGYGDIQFAPTNPRKLAVLDLSNGGITETWMGWSYIKLAETLKVLDLTYSPKISRIPNLSANLQLKVLILKECENLATIEDSIGHLKSLVELNLGRCRSLKYFPTSICELTSLEILDISDTGICKLPENLGNLKALKYLLIHVTPIRQLPNSIGHLRNLNTLNARGCEIQEGGIPDVIGRLSSLKFLDLGGNGFHSLPATVSELSLLHTLTLEMCGKLQSLPRLSNLTNLKILDFDFCENLVEIPVTINALTRMEKLRITACHALEYIPHLPSSLMRLDVRYCENMREISTFSGLRNLVKLVLFRCKSLAKVEGLEGLYSLEYLKICDCNSLRKFPNLSNLKTLVTIKFRDCSELSAIEGLEGLASLKKLFLEGFRSLTKIKLPKKLQKLRIKDCEKLTEIEGVEDLESLEIRKIHDPLSLLLHVSALKNLKYLQLRQCDCMERLPDLSNLNKLNILQIYSCKKLIEIPGFGSLESLEVLEVLDCVSMEILPDLSNLTKLRELRIKHCEKLIEIQGVDKLEILEELLIDGCISIETLPCLSNLKKLKILSAVDCEKVTEIQGIDKLESLEKLNVRG